MPERNRSQTGTGYGEAPLTCGDGDGNGNGHSGAEGFVDFGIAGWAIMGDGVGMGDGEGGGMLFVVRDPMIGYGESPRQFGDATNGEGFGAGSGDGRWRGFWSV